MYGILPLDLTHKHIGYNIGNGDVHVHMQLHVHVHVSLTICNTRIIDNTCKIDNLNINNKRNSYPSFNTHTAIKQKNYNIEKGDEFPRIDS